MTVEEFLQPASPTNPCPIKISDTFWIRRLREFIEAGDGERMEISRLAEEVTRLGLINEGLAERLRLANEALVAKVIAAEKALNTRPPLKKRAAKRRTTPAPKGVNESS